MPSRPEIDEWAAVINELSLAADGFRATAVQVEIAADAHVHHLLNPGGTDWEGDAADAAQHQGYSDRGVVYAAADLMRQMSREASTGAACLEQSRNLVLEAIAEAEADDFRVDENLAVTDIRRYTQQQAASYEARKVMAATHHGYIVMRARNLLTDDVRVGAELSAGAARLADITPPDWLQEQPSGRDASDGDGDVHAYDEHTGGDDALSGEQIADRLRELERGLNRGVREVGTEEEIFDLYEELAKGGAALPTPDNYYDRRSLPDGTIIGIRESSGHGPTLDVKYPSGVSGPDKVHLPPPPPIAPPPSPPTPDGAPIIGVPPSLPTIDHPPAAPGLIPPWAQAPTGPPQAPLPSGGLPPGIGNAPPALPQLPPVETAPGWLPDVTVRAPTPEEQVGIGGVLFGGLLAFLGWLGTPKVSY